MPEIGFIGLGNMGSALARRLLRRHRVHVWDINPEAVKELAREGAVAANGSVGVAESGAEFIVTCLPTSTEVNEVLFGPEGIAAHLDEGVLVADMTTGDPLLTNTLAQRLASQGVDMIDAPVSGGVKGAQAGTIAIMVGGSASAFTRARAILETISPNVFHAGDSGAGHAMKVINNMISSCTRVAVFEGLVLAVKAGLDPGRFAEILSKGTGRGYVADTTLPDFVLPGRIDQGFGLALMHKDLVLATGLGQEMKVPLSAGCHAREVFCRALNELGTEVDITQLVRIFESDANVDVCQPDRD